MGAGVNAQPVVLTAGPVAHIGLHKLVSGLGDDRPEVGVILAAPPNALPVQGGAHVVAHVFVLPGVGVVVLFDGVVLDQVAVVHGALALVQRPLAVIVNVQDTLRVGIAVQVPCAGDVLEAALGVGGGDLPLKIAEAVKLHVPVVGGEQVGAIVGVVKDR